MSPKPTPAVLQHLNSLRALNLELNRAVLAYCEGVENPSLLPVDERLQRYQRMRALVVEVSRCMGCGSVQTGDYTQLRFCPICSSD